MFQVSSSTKRKTTSALAVLAALGAAGVASQANAAELNWSGGGAAGDWNDGANWGGTAPGVGDTAWIASNVAFTNSSISVGRVLVKSGATVTFNSLNWGSDYGVNYVYGPYGGGTMIINGTGTGPVYSGPIAYGTSSTLVINGTITAGASPSANNGGTIRGTGTVHYLTIGGGSNISPGPVAGGIGTFTSTGVLIFDAGSSSGGYQNIYNCDVANDGTSDLIDTASTLYLYGGNEKLAVSGTLNPTLTYTIATFGGLNGTFENVTGLGSTHTVQYNANSITLVPVPEPASMGLLVLGAAGTLLRRRRK